MKQGRLDGREAETDEGRQEKKVDRETVMRRASLAI
jgi:hypothetical protein